MPLATIVFADKTHKAVGDKEKALKAYLWKYGEIPITPVVASYRERITRVILPPAWAALVPNYKPVRAAVDVSDIKLEVRGLDDPNTDPRRLESTTGFTDTYDARYH